MTSSADPSSYGQDVQFTVTATPEAGAIYDPTTPEQVTFTLTGTSPSDPYTTNPIVDPTEVLTNNGGVITATFDPNTFAGAVLPPDQYTVSVTYAGDGTFASDSTLLFPPSSFPPGPGQIVQPTNTSVTLLPLGSTPVFGAPVTVTAQVASAVSPLLPNAVLPGQAGVESVTFTIDAGTANQQIQTGTIDPTTGQASVTFSGLGVGPQTIKATYAGDQYYNGSSRTSTTLINVGKATPTIAVISASPSSPTFGQAVSFTAQVTPVFGGTPTGSVTFFDGTHNLGAYALNTSSEQAITSPAIASLAAGSHTITAVYNGDNNFTSATSSTFLLQIAQGSTTATISPLTATATVGQSVTFTATVTAVAPAPGIPQGTVTFIVDGANQTPSVTLNALGQAFFSARLSAGQHMITVVYNGSANFLASSQAPPATLTVTAGQTSTVVQSSINSTVFGQPITLTATVNPVAPASGTPTGSVSFYADGTTFLGSVSLPAGSNVATLTNVTSLTIGSHAITAQYSGDSFFGSSTSPSINQSVTKDNSNTLLTSSANPAVFGQTVTLTATVSASAPGSGAPTGTVTFDDGSTPLTGGSESYSVVGGNLVATYTTTSLSLTSHSIVAAYSGDTNFNSSNSTSLSQTVTKASTSAVVVSSAPANLSAYGQAVTFTATVAAVSPGVGTPTGTVAFLDGATALQGTVVYTVIGGNLVASYTTSTLAVVTGGHSITVKYSGDNNFLATISPAITQTIVQTSTTTRCPQCRPTRLG